MPGERQLTKQLAGSIEILFGERAPALEEEVEPLRLEEDFGQEQLPPLIRRKSSMAEELDEIVQVLHVRELVVRTVLTLQSRGPVGKVERIDLAPVEDNLEARLPDHNGRPAVTPWPVHDLNLFDSPLGTTDLHRFSFGRKLMCPS